MFSSADAYDRFIGRYGGSLSQAHIAAAEVAEDDSVLDVGCGTGTLTAALADWVGATRVAAVDPSPDLVEACRARVPEADVRIGTAEELPDFGPQFDVVLSQLVVNFMTDARAGVRAMRASSRTGGVVSACVWDYADGMTMLRAYWDAAIELDPAAPDEGRTMAHCSAESLAELWTEAGLEDVETRELSATAEYDDFEDLWAPFPMGVGPAGAYCASLTTEQRHTLRKEFHRRLGAPTGAFELRARAWFVRGRA